MTEDGPHDERQAEALVGVRKMSDTDEHAPGAELHFIREMSPAESEASIAAVELMKSLTDRSPLLLFSEVRDEVMHAILDLEASTDAFRFDLAARKVHRTFKSFLSELRTFDDHTSHWISGHFDRGHAYAEFKSALSEAYDTNFAYRFHYSLRNVSEHAGRRMLNGLKFTSFEGDGDRPSTEVCVRLDPGQLIRDFPTLKAAIKAELSPISADLEVEWMLGATFNSCERAYSRLLLALEPEIRTAVALIKGVNDEAIAGGGASAWFIPASTSGRPMSIRDNEYERARGVLANLDEARLVVSRPVLSMEAVDFVALGDERREPVRP